MWPTKYASAVPKNLVVNFWVSWTLVDPKNLCTLVDPNLAVPLWTSVVRESWYINFLNRNHMGRFLIKKDWLFELKVPMSMSDCD